MLKFVDDICELKFDHDTSIVMIPILSDAKLHRQENRISFIYIHDINTNINYVISCNHNDATKHGLDWLNAIKLPKRIYTYTSNILRQYGITAIDISMYNWLIYNESLEIKYSNDIEVYHNWYYKYKNVNDSIPIVNFIPFCENIVEITKRLIKVNIPDKILYFYNNVVLNNYYEIENYGIPTNSELLNQIHNKTGSVIYSEYNPYTATGRPSNRFGGINFAALNKENGERAIINVQSPEELLIDFDYDSYHVKLVAQLIGYELPDVNLHEYFGRMYFDKSELTDEEYNESKQLTFQLLYGTMQEEFTSIEFFKKIYEFRKSQWKFWNEHGYIELPNTSRRIYKFNFNSMTENKLFNYLIQSHETDVNNCMLRKILQYLYDKRSKLILYTYDSFLFVYNSKDGKTFINDIINILESFNMTVKMKIGFDYYNMKTKHKI